jgi:16S rRNA pseudouridine516 synthase
VTESTVRRQRLDRRVAQATGLSRQRAQRAIRAGQVSVDGAVQHDPALAVMPTATLEMDGRVLAQPGPRYYMLNKPVGVVCANTDRSHRTVFDLLDLPNPSGLHVAGRLDIDATGLVLITDDGDWSHQITSPRHKQPKAYTVELAEPVTPEACRQIESGVMLRGESSPCAPARVEVLGARVIRLILTEGKYHQVKRMLAAVGNHVTGLHREQIGSIHLDPQLPAGGFRPLLPEETESVRHFG